jgi:hypothetical protein
MEEQPGGGLDRQIKDALDFLWALGVRARLEMRNVANSPMAAEYPLTPSVFGDEALGLEELLALARAWTENIPRNGTRRGMSFLFAPPGSGKSFFLQELYKRLTALGDRIVAPVTFNSPSAFGEEDKKNLESALMLRIACAVFVQHDPHDALLWSRSYDRIRKVTSWPKYAELRNPPELVDHLRTIDWLASGQKHRAPRRRDGSQGPALRYVGPAQDSRR